MKKIINIKGKRYTVLLKDRIFDEETGKELYGFCNSVKKEIVISTNNVDLIESSLIHELLHAYLDESGLFAYSNDENLIYWFEMHLKEIYKKVRDVCFSYYMSKLESIKSNLDKTLKENF